ncbi:unnamed protein product [Effrenium voratum]|nr:unnamed protein product [Effrenium voratum]
MWLQLLTSLRRPRALVRHFRSNLAKKGELGISEHWLFGAEGIGGRKRLRRKQRAALQQRMLFEVLIDGSTMRVAEYASKLVHSLHARLWALASNGEKSLPASTVLVQTQVAGEQGQGALRHLGGLSTFPALHVGAQK